MNRTTAQLIQMSSSLTKSSSVLPNKKIFPNNFVLSSLLFLFLFTSGISLLSGFFQAYPLSDNVFRAKAELTTSTAAPQSSMAISHAAPELNALKSPAAFSSVISKNESPLSISCRLAQKQTTSSLQEYLAFRERRFGDRVNGAIKIKELDELSVLISQGTLYSNETTFLLEKHLLKNCVSSFYSELLNNNHSAANHELDFNKTSMNEALECPRIPLSSPNQKLLHLLRQTHFAISAKTSNQHARYTAIVNKYAKRYNMPTALIFAIMHAESNFIATAISPSNALGLMQVVPDTAGGEAHFYLTGRRELPSTNILFSPESNIQYGATYLHLLNSKHFSGVVNPVSRQLCVIAAYNGGPGAVHRVFNAEKEEAIKIINSLSAGDVYKFLCEKMPTTESRQYIDKVLRHVSSYSQATNVLASLMR